MKHFGSICAIVLFNTLNLASAQETVNLKWDPIADADRELKAPTIEKDAGVEAIFWNVHVRDELRPGDPPQRIFYHYIRLKIFDEKGKEKFSTIDIEFGPKVSITSIAARTIRPDGSIVEMKKDAVYQRDLVRVGGEKVKVKSFALPAVEPGVIVEYRYKEIRETWNIAYARLQMQREFPVRRVTYYVMPLPHDVLPWGMATWNFNCKPSPVKRENDGYSSFYLENVPAFHAEPYSTGEPNIRPWVLLMYREDDKREPEKYWAKIGREKYDELKQGLKANDDIKHTATEVVSGANTPEEKAAAIVQYLWKHTKNLWDSSVSEADRKKILAKMPTTGRRSAADVLKSGLGTDEERNLVFAAMATSVGLETRPVLMPNRNDILFDPRMADSYFLENADIAVKIGDDWKFYDVSVRMPPGMVTWSEEGVSALLSDPKKPTFITSKTAPPDQSLFKRSAKMTLGEDGTLEGDIEESFTGHAAPTERSGLVDESEARQKEIVKEQITKVFAQAEVTAIALENVDNPAKALTIKYHIKLPSYAARTAKRILIQPLYFQRGDPPVFTATERRHDIAFHYAWKEHDEISIKFPAGYVLDKGMNPGAIPFGKSGGYNLQMAIRGKEELLVTRDLTFGDGALLNIPRQSYAQVKEVFDAIHGNDGVTVTLRQGEVTQ